MKPEQFNEHVHTEIVVTVPLTIRAFTSGKSSLTAISEMLAYMERQLQLKDPSDIADWYYWDKVWPVEISTGDISKARVLPVAKLAVPEEVSEPEA